MRYNKFSEGGKVMFRAARTEIFAAWSPLYNIRECKNLRRVRLAAGASTNDAAKT